MCESALYSVVPLASGGVLPPPRRYSTPVEMVVKVVFALCVCVCCVHASEIPFALESANTNAFETTSCDVTAGDFRSYLLCVVC